LLGATDKDLAAAYNVTEQTVNNWKKSKHGFFESIKEAKSAADLQVEQALFKRALGYSHAEDKIFNNGGEALVVGTTKSYPPDTAACMAWLYNRSPARWKREPEGASTAQPITIEIINPHG